MTTHEKNGKTTETAVLNPLPYDSKALIAALATLSQPEIESMLGHISSLETHIAKFNPAGSEDAMMRLVTDGLRRLTYFLDAVKSHQDESREDK